GFLRLLPLLQLLHLLCVFLLHLLRLLLVPLFHLLCSCVIGIPLFHPLVFLGLLLLELLVFLLHLRIELVLLSLVFLVQFGVPRIWRSGAFVRCKVIGVNGRSRNVVGWALVAVRLTSRRAWNVVLRAPSGLPALGTVGSMLV